MRLVAIFEDDPEAADVRRQHSAAHFDYLTRNAGKIRLAGGLHRETDDGFVGGMWILDVDSRKEAVRLCEEDPYFVNGLRKDYRLLRWGRAPSYGEAGSVAL